MVSFVQRKPLPKSNHKRGDSESRPSDFRRPPCQSSCAHRSFRIGGGQNPPRYASAETTLLPRVFRDKFSEGGYAGSQNEAKS